MTRTTNTLRVTFSANLDSGEGYLTEKSRDTLDSIPDEGWLWAKDVLTDWQSDIDRQLEYAEAAFLGWCDYGNPNLKPARTVEEMAQRLWLGGVWPDSFGATYYESRAQTQDGPCVGGDLDQCGETDDYVLSPSFREWMVSRAKRDAKNTISEMKDTGVKYNHGMHPSHSDLTMFFILSDLVGKAENVSLVFDNGCEASSRVAAE